MPSEEESRGMDQLGINYMRCLEVIVSGTGTWSLGGIDLGRQLVQTFDSLDVFKTSLILQVGPTIKISVSV